MTRMNEPEQGAEQKARETAADVGEQVREKGAQLRDAAAERFEEMRQQASEYYEQGRERAREIEQNLEHYVQEKPIQALLIAAGVGMLLGLLWKRS